MSDVVRVDEVMTRLDCSMGKAYKIIKTLNDELVDCKIKLDT